MANWLWIGSSGLLCFQWLGIHFAGLHLLPHFEALSSGLAIFGAAFMLSWAAELSQKDIPQALAIALLALIAVLPEYAVDMYFAWTAGKDRKIGLRDSQDHYILTRRADFTKVNGGTSDQTLSRRW